MLQRSSYYVLHLTSCGLDVLVVVLETHTALAVRRGRREAQKGLSQDIYTEGLSLYCFPLTCCVLCFYP